MCPASPKPAGFLHDIMRNFTVITVYTPAGANDAWIHQFYTSVNPRCDIPAGYAIYLSKLLHDTRDIHKVF